MNMTKAFNESKDKNKFTIVSDDSSAVIFFEGKTVYASTHEDFHSGHDDVYFMKKKITKSWKSPEHLTLILQTMIKTKTKVAEVQLDTDEVFSFCEKNDLWCSDDSFCA